MYYQSIEENAGGTEKSYRRLFCTHHPDHSLHRKKVYTEKKVEPKRLHPWNRFNYHDT